jgi:D-alanyl-D-alanine carboxypeptidase
MRIIGVVLNCPDCFNEAARLMDIAFDRYEAVTMLHAGEAVGSLPVANSNGASVEALLAADLTGVMPKGSLPQVEIGLPDALDAPIQAGQIIGTARMLAGGVVIAEAPLVASADVARDDFPARWHMYWRNWLGTPSA